MPNAMHPLRQPCSDPPKSAAPPRHPLRGEELGTGSCLKRLAPPEQLDVLILPKDVQPESAAAARVQHEVALRVVGPEGVDR